MSLVSLQQDVEAIREERMHDAENVDAFFLVSMTILVLLMQFGLSIRECGVVKFKNVSGVLLRNMLCTSIGMFGNWLVGYGFAFGDGNVFIGERFFAASYLPEVRLSHFLFHVILSVITSSIVANAFTERCRLVAHIVTTILLTGFVNPCITHWAWSPQGWLTVGVNVTGMENVTVTFQDYAGSGVIHLSAGMMALIGCLMLGPRIGRFEEWGYPDYIPVHSVPLTAVGSFLIIVGFLGLGAGCLGHVSRPGDGATVGLVTTNLIISGCASLITTALVQLFTYVTGGGLHQFRVLWMTNAVLVGMVSMSAGADAVEPRAAAIIGFIAALAFRLWTWFFLKIKVDGALDIISVHMGGGLWGTMAVPLFRKTDGVVYRWSRFGWTSFGWNMAGTLAIMAWVVVFSVILFGLLSACKLLRVRKDTKPTVKHSHRSCCVTIGTSKGGRKRSHRQTMPAHQQVGHQRPDCFSPSDDVIPVYKPFHSTHYPTNMYGAAPPLHRQY